MRLAAALRASLLALVLAAQACGDERSRPAPASPPERSQKTSKTPDRQEQAPAAPSLARVAVPRGAALYARMCAVCHGASGEGYKADRAPAIAHPDFLASASDDFLRAAILEGRRNTTMSAWGRHRGGPLSESDAADLVAFMRTWHRHPAAELDERPLAGDPSRGKPTYERECARCHGPSGVGGPHTQLADPHLLSHASEGFLRYAIARGRSGTPMEGYANKLDARTIDDVIAFVRDASLQHEAEVAAAAKEPPLPLPRGVARNPRGPQPVGFVPHPGTTKSDVVHLQLSRGARMAFLDARVPSDYLLEHIAGAVSVPFYEPEPYLQALPKDVWLVCYCGCPHAESKILAQKLVDRGFALVTVLDEGIGFWKMKGYPVSTGSAP